MITTSNSTKLPQVRDKSAGSAARLPASRMMNGETGVIPGALQLSLADYPALAAMRLTDADLHELTHQGFVCREERGNVAYFKLRFRRAHQQVVRYVGDAAHAAAIQAELDRLQADRRLERELGRITSTARRMLRAGKRQLEPLLAKENLKFHGLALRRPRK
jgi:hypothetical protein